jgi:hypothetical protein
MAKRRDEALKHPDTPTMIKACVQHIAENAKKKLHNGKEKKLRKSNTRNNYSNNKEVFYKTEFKKSIFTRKRRGHLSILEPS